MLILLRASAPLPGAPYITSLRLRTPRVYTPFLVQREGTGQNTQDQAQHRDTSVYPGSGRTNAKTPTSCLSNPSLLMMNSLHRELRLPLPTPPIQLFSPPSLEPTFLSTRAPLLYLKEVVHGVSACLTHVVNRLKCPQGPPGWGTVKPSCPFIACRF